MSELPLNFAIEHPAAAAEHSSRNPAWIPSPCPAFGKELASDFRLEFGVRRHERSEFVINGNGVELTDLGLNIEMRQTNLDSQAISLVYVHQGDAQR